MGGSCAGGGYEDQAAVWEVGGRDRSVAGLISLQTGRHCNTRVTHIHSAPHFVPLISELPEIGISAATVAAACRQIPVRGEEGSLAAPG